MRRLLTAVLLVIVGLANTACAQTTRGAYGFQPAVYTETSWAACNGMCRLQEARNWCQVNAPMPQHLGGEQEAQLMSFESREMYRDYVEAKCPNGGAVAYAPPVARVQPIGYHRPVVASRRGRAYCAKLGSEAFLISNPKPAGPGWEMTPFVPGKPCGGWRRQRL